MCRGRAERRCPGQRADGDHCPRVRPGLSFEDARDVVWTLCSLAVHDLLVVDRGWSSERYREWLTDGLIRALLPDAGSGTRTGSAMG